MARKIEVTGKALLYTRDGVEIVDAEVRRKFPKNSPTSSPCVSVALSGSDTMRRRALNFSASSTSRELSDEQKEIVDEYNKVAELFYKKNDRPKATGL